MQINSEISLMDDRKEMVVELQTVVEIPLIDGRVFSEFQKDMVEILYIKFFLLIIEMYKIIV